MSQDQHTTEQGPSEALSAPESAETPGVGASRRPAPVNGAQAGAESFPDVQGRCPACGGQSLMLADGGYITCRRLDCPNPEAAYEAIEERAGANAYDRAINTPPSVEACAAIRERLESGTMPRRKVRARPAATPAPADLRQRVAGALHTQMPGCTHDEHGNDCVSLADAVLAAVQPAIGELAQAIRLTREYIGEELLPPIEGWSWYDALRRWAPHELQPPAPAHNAGPSVAEAKADDRRWPLQKHGE